MAVYQLALLAILDGPPLGTDIHAATDADPSFRVTRHGVRFCPWLRLAWAI